MFVHWLESCYSRTPRHLTAAKQWKTAYVIDYTSIWHSNNFKGSQFCQNGTWLLEHTSSYTVQVGLHIWLTSLSRIAFSALMLSGEVLAWLSVWSEVQICIWPSWCHCYSLSLASVKSRLVLPFWYWPTRVVPEKGPLNGCVCVCVCSLSRMEQVSAVASKNTGWNHAVDRAWQSLW